MLMLPRYKNIVARCFLMVCAFVLVTGCCKDNQKTEIKDVTGYTWKLGPIKAASDSYISPVPASWQLTLTDQSKFVFQLNSCSCTGTYSWIVIDSLSANVRFSIKQWNNPTEYPGSADKLKAILAGINKCYLLKGADIPLVISAFTNPSIVLDFEGRDGYFYLYR